MTNLNSRVNPTEVREPWTFDQKSPIVKMEEDYEVCSQRHFLSLRIFILNRSQTRNGVVTYTVYVF